MNDVIDKMCEAYDPSQYPDAAAIKAMTRAAHVLITEGLGPVTDEETEYLQDARGIDQANALLAARRARLLPEHKDAAVEAVQALLGHGAGLFPPASIIVAAVRKADRGQS